MVGAHAQTSSVNKPNIVFIYTDDQRFDALSLVQEAQAAKARFPWFKTPNIDRIGREGVRFSNAFVVSSLCSPSRASMLTSQYNHQNGIANNHTVFTNTDPTYATELQQAGYSTGFIGKWHMANQRGPRPGFNYSFSFFGQGKYHDCPFQLNGDQIIETKGWVDDVSTDSALAFIKRNADRPFMLALAFKSSHGPWSPPERLANAYSEVKLTPPVSEGVDAPYKGKVAVNRPRKNNKDIGQKTIESQQVSWTAKNDKMIRNYFRVLKAVDENVGHILDLLDSMRLAEHTVVVFTTDNGYFLGEHHLGDKRAAYEESMRVPLLVRYPAYLPPGKVVDKLVLNIDIAPTFLDFAGIPTPHTFQGESWGPLAEGKAIPWRKSFLYEYFYERNFNTPTVVALRTENAKLVVYPGQEEWAEMFDLTTDPNEKHNLYQDLKEIHLNEKDQYRNLPILKLKEELETALEEQKRLVGFKIPAYADTALRDSKGKYILDQRNPDRDKIKNE
ncbi:sulfatase [Olivibacter ginsenosidimutans]|uniref:Sulfatase n=1 Tax=Olivibacter ginsenosidimutans TaxID=1176537 RepID=A0ABP9BR94_9SPHI